MRKSRYSKSIASPKKITIDEAPISKKENKEETKYPTYDSTNDSGFLSTLTTFITNIFN